MSDIQSLVAKLTLEEKASLCSGLNFWNTKPIERLGIPSIMMTDGPHGLRKQVAAGDHLGLNEAVPATCFPAGCASACSFDVELMAQLGDALGQECEAEGVSMVLGPALNIKRSPLCGRNFEYLSEDPFLAGRMAAAHVKGVQAHNVAACPKHFAANNQENRRFTADSQMDERTLREIYLSAFEHVTKEAHPWTFMSSYNRLNGEYTARTHRLLTEILRDEWGFDGFVVSDWGGTNDRVRCLEAGMDLEMPFVGPHNDQLIVEAVKSGVLDEAVLDRALERLIRITLKTRKDQAAAPARQLDAHDELACKIATESAVLLQNDGTLPLEKGADACFIGEFFERPRFQGGGSSHINAYKVTSARDLMPDAPYAKGFRIDTDECDQALEQAAVELAKAHEVVVVFAGLPDAYESEGFDREHMEMPFNQLHLLDALVALGKKLVVVLHHGSPVEMDWADDAAAVLDMYLGGQAVGRAAVKLLYGEANPSGKLAETVPYQLSDTPCYPWYNLDGDDAPYREGIFVGYRYYDIKQMPVRYPFGHGLSYTKFAYADLAVDREETDGPVMVRCTVKNVGARAGKEVAQLYVCPPEGTGVTRPEQELKGFVKVALQPGESKVVEFELDRRSFARWSEKTNGWFVDPGEYGIVVAGASAQDFGAEMATVKVLSEDREPVVVDRDTMIGTLMKDERAKAMFEGMLAQSPLMAMAGDGEDRTGLRAMFERMVQYMPLRQMGMMGMDPQQLDGLIAQLKAMLS